MLGIESLYELDHQQLKSMAGETRMFKCSYSDVCDLSVVWGFPINPLLRSFIGRGKTSLSLD